ncbi:MAG: exodeoxyribonuclease III [Thermomicrobiales bacterium]
MKLFSWNVNGIRAVIRKGDFQTFIADHQPHILCLQETKAKREQVKIELPGYIEHWYSADKAGYSGTAIFTRIEPTSVITGLPEPIAKEFSLAGDRYGNPNQEGRVIAAEFDSFWLVTVYTPNSKGDLSRLDLRYNAWDPAFLTYVKQLEAGEFGSRSAKPVIFSGDLNVAHQEIDLARPKENHRTHGFTDEERERFQHFLNHGFIDTFRTLHPDTTEAYTWWNMMTKSRERNVGWRIDYFLISQVLAPHLIAASIHADILGSDHCPISIELTGI